jgi:uncharacterized protein (TIGR02246 family)
MKRWETYGFAALIGVACLAVTLPRSASSRANAADPREVLMDLDREFDRATAERGADAWASYFAEDGMMFPEGGEIIRGRAAIREAMAKVFKGPGFSLRWQPAGGTVSRSNDLGFTYGTFVAAGRNASGEEVRRHGKYVTIWQKQKDGTWKIVLDAGNQGPAPASP